MSLIKKWLSCLLVFSMILGILPVGTLAAYSDAGAPFDSQFEITKDGVRISAADAAALIDRGASLDEIILVDGVAVTLGDFQKMLEIEAEIDRLDKTYFSRNTDWSPEQQAALLSLQQQLQTSGLALRGGEVSFPSGFDYSAKVTAVADQSVVNNTTGTVTVTYTLSKELAHDVRFSVRTVSGSAAAGTNYTSVSAAVEIEAGDTSAQVTVDIKAAAVWNGQKTFFVEAYDIGGALFDDGSLRCSVPVAIQSSKEYAEADFTNTVKNSVYYAIPVPPDTWTPFFGSSGTTPNWDTGLSTTQLNSIVDGIITHLDLAINYSVSQPSGHPDIRLNYLEVQIGGTARLGMGYRITWDGGTPTGYSAYNIPFMPVDIRTLPNRTMHIIPGYETITDNGGGSYSGTPNNIDYNGYKNAQSATLTFLDQANPQVVGVTMDESGSYGVSGIVPVVVTFSEPVSPDRAVAVINGTACSPIETGDATKTLTFAYVAQPGDSDQLTVSKISGAVDLSGLEMGADTAGYTLGSGNSKIVHTVADGVRASTLIADKEQYSAAEAMATFTLTLPENTVLSDAIKAGWSISPESHCPNVFLSIDGGQTLEKLYPVGDDALTALSASLSLSSLAEGQSYVAELFTADGKLFPGTYTIFSRGETVLLTTDDFSIEPPPGFPGKDLYGDVLPDVSALKLGINVGGGDFTWADTTKTTAYDQNGALPAGNFHFAWRSSNHGVATIDTDGQIHLTGLSGTAAFTLTALNGGRSLAVSDAVSITVRPGHAPFLTVPDSSKTIIGRAQEAVTVYWASNLAEKNHEAVAGHVTQFTVSVYRADNLGAKTGDAVSETTVASSMEKPVSSAVLTGLDQISIGDSPSYIVEIKASTLSGVVGGARELSAEAAIVIRSQPAIARLTHPASLYLTDKNSSVSVDWALEHFDQQNQADFKLTVTDNATGTKIVDQQSTEENSGTVQFSVTGGDFRNLYTVELWAKNSEDPTWSRDSFVLTVYAADALEILVEGGAKDSLTLSNHDWISGLSQNEILALSRDITLEKAISINYGEKAWSEIRDRIVWSVADSDIAGLSAKQGSFYEDIQTLPYTSYAPASDFLVSGLTDGSTTLKAAHALLGDDLSDSVNLHVDTLRGHLYLFNFYPAVQTTISYNNGKKAVSNAQGQAAIYEENGIDGTIYVQSEQDGIIYVGTLSAQTLASGENSTVSLELYPVNNFKLHPAASVPLRFVDGENKPLTGNIAIRGGVYRNGAYCPDAIIDNKAPGVGVTSDYTITPDTDGSYTFNFAIEKFLTESDGTPVTAQDDISFLFEVRADGYYPMLLSVDGNLNTRAAIRTGTRVITLEEMPVSAAGKPYVTSQTLYYSDSAQGMGTSILGVKGKIGPSDAAAQATVETVVLWPGTEATDIDRYQLQIVNANGRLAPVQTTSAIRYPFSTITVVENLLPLNKSSMESWGLSNPFSTQQVNLRYTAGGTLVKSEQTNLRVVNMIGYDPAKSGDMDSFKSDMTSVILKSVSSGLDMDGGFLALGMKYASSMKIDTPILKFQLAPTADPTVFRALFYAGVDMVNEEEGDQKISYTPGLSDAKDTYKKGMNGYLSDSMDSVEKAFKTLKSNALGKSGGAWSGDDDVKFALTGYFEAEIFYDYDANRWECDFLNGDFTAGGGYGYEWTYNTSVGPVPVVAQFSLGATAQLNVKVASDKIEDRTDFLTTLRIQAYFRAFGGIGFDYSVVALKLGLYGQLDFDAQLRWLSQLHGDTAYTYNIALDGEVGIQFVAKLLFASYEKTLWSKEIPIKDWKKSNWNAIEEYWKTVSSGRSGNQYQILSGTARLLSYDQTTGFALYESPSVARLEARDYLSRYTRTWRGGGIRLFSLDAPNGAPQSLQTNAYPYADPRLSDDGSLMLYLTDQGNTDITQTRAAVSVKSGGSYQEGTIIDDGGYGDSQLSLTGTGSFAVAAWTRLSEDQIKKDPGSEITPDEQAMMLNATEIMASVYIGGAWQTTALTSNTTADMAPVAVTDGSKAIVLWRSVAGTSSEALLNFNAKDRIYYRVFNGSGWEAVQTLYNGTSGAVKAIDAVMASDGTTAVTYTVKSGSDDMVTTDLDIVYAVIGTDNEVQRNVRLTADSFTNENPQLAAVKLSAGDTYEGFVLGWHSMQNADGIEKHDIRLAAFDRNGNLVPGFVDSLSDLIYNAQTNLTADFTFTRNAKTIDALSIVWKEPALDYFEEGTAEHDVLSALRFMTTDSGAVSVTAAQRLAEMEDETTIDSFDVYVTPGGEIKAVLLGTTYDFSSLVQDGVVTDESGETTNIYLPQTQSGLYTATMAYTDAIRMDSVIPDFQAIYKGGVVPIQFSLTNLGTEPVETLEIVVGDQPYTFDAGKLVPIAPGENRTVIVNYRIPDDTLENANYTVEAQFASGGKNSAAGTIALDIPDLGISVLELQNAEGGKRYLRLGAYNESDSELFGSRRSVAIGLYADSACTIPVDAAYFTPITVTGNELQLIDNATYMTQLVFDLAGYVKAAGNEDYLTQAGEVRGEGVTLYARATVLETDPSSAQPEEVNEYLTQNNTRAVTFGSLLDAADGEAASITTTMETSESETEVVVTLQNNSINTAANGNVIVSLLSETGELIAQKQVYTGSAASLLNLAPEEKESLTFTFPQAGASVTAAFSQAVLATNEAELSLLNASEIPVSIKDFVYDKDRNLYTTTVSVTDMQFTTATAVAKAADGRVSIDDKTDDLNSMSARVPLTPGKTTVVSIQSTSADATTACSYELVIENRNSAQPGPSGGGSTTVNSVSPQTAVFDLDPKSTDHADVTVTVISDGAVKSVTLDGKALSRDKDYTVDGNRYLFKKEFLETCTVGTHRLTFLMSSGTDPAVMLTVKDTGAAWQNPFADVSPDDWFYDAVQYAVQNELFNGTSATAFSPNADMTRAMLVTVLYRLEGKPAVPAANGFTDVQSSQWYTDAVNWANANKIVEGYGSGTFGTNDSITREQMAAILYRYAKLKGYDMTTTTKLTKYTDATALSAWATDAMQWANAAGLITGTTDITLSPTGKASRAQVATILMRFCENVAK